VQLLGDGLQARFDLTLLVGQLIERRPAQSVTGLPGDSRLLADLLQLLDSGG
jgi:hypothetical protein